VSRKPRNSGDCPLVRDAAAIATLPQLRRCERALASTHETPAFPAERNNAALADLLGHAGPASGHTPALAASSSTPSAANYFPVGTIPGTSPAPAAAAARCADPFRWSTDESGEGRFRNPGEQGPDGPADAGGERCVVPARQSRSRETCLPRKRGTRPRSARCARWHKSRSACREFLPSRRTSGLGWQLAPAGGAGPQIS
jgi:hypothetical protein